MRALFCFLLLTLAASGATFKSDPVTVTMSGKHIDHTYGFAIIRVSDNTFYNVASYTPLGGLGASEVTKTTNSIQLTFDFYIVGFSARSGLWGNVDNAAAVGGVGKKYRWISAYEVGGEEAQNSSDGPYTGGDPTDENGNPADPAIGGSPTPTSHDKDVTLVNPTDEEKAFSVRMKGAAGNILSSNTIILRPRETRVIHLKADQPFTVEVYDMVKVVRPDEEFPGEGREQYMTTGNPVQTLSSEGTQEPAPASGGPEMTQQSSTSAGTPGQPGAASVSRDGTLEGNADARNQELRNELQRNTDQTKDSGDQITNAIDKLGAKLGGTGTGSTGDALGTPSASGMDFAGSIGGKAASVGTALGNLFAAAGLANTPGFNALSWSIPVMGQSYTVSVEEYADTISIVRQAILAVASAFFVFAAFAIIRGAFVDEGTK